MNTRNVFTNVYGIARSLLAAGTLITLLFTNPADYFPHSSFEVMANKQGGIPNFFYLLGEGNLYITITLAVIAMLWVISGYLPQVTGILHAWITTSFFTGSLVVEGGDQIGQIITILLIPITLFDKRINHWARADFFTYKRPEALSYFCSTTLTIIKVQMAVLYFFAATEKLKVKEWIDGTAIYYWVDNNIFGAPDYLRFAVMPFVSSPQITPIITWGIIVLEGLLFAALFMNPERRKLLLIPALFFHFAIVLIHGLPSFFFAMAGGLVLYLLPSEWISWPAVSLPKFKSATSQV